MRTILLLVFITVAYSASAQKCGASEYLNLLKSADPTVSWKMEQIEKFVQKQGVTSSNQNQKTDQFNIIRIPVVVHVIYNTAEQNISEEQIRSQIAVLNRDFRRLNPDSINTPQRFKSLAADAQIEFQLATADPMGRSTTGIIRKKTNVNAWSMNDKIKFSTEGGDNAWDSKSYLNIWIGNFTYALGYASAPGTDPSKDGVVISYKAFGTINTPAPYNLGKTAVHEVGHWLGLKHIWGDTYCGDDMVEDTPPQSNFTPGCPTAFRTSCTNGTTGDMYMNYMDFTNDACINMFTVGQKNRMRSFFFAGGPRASLLISKGLNAPWLEEAPQPEVVTKEARMYPNPATEEVILNFEADETWIGKKIQMFNSNGVLVNTIQLYSTSQRVGLSSYKPGVFFFKGENGEQKFLQKLVKL